MSRNEYRAPNPKDMVTFVNVHLQRATDLAFTAPVDVETKAADTTNEATVFIDTGGTTSSYYRHRGENASALTVTDWSDPILFGDYVVRQRIIRDCSILGIVPSGIDNNDWDSWRDQTFLDMQAKGLGRPADVQELSMTAGVDEWRGLNADIRRVTSVEVWRTSTDYWTSIRGWDQRGRQIRIYKPLGTPYTYKVYGRGELRDLTDLDDELWGILYWGMKWYYILKRQIERGDTRPFMGRTRTADTPGHTNYQQFADAAYAKFIERIYDVLRNEGVPSGEGGR